MNLKSVLGSYLGHLTTYVVAAAGIAAALKPAFFTAFGLNPAVATLIISGAGFVTAAAHHGYKAGVVAQAAIAAATKAIAPVLCVAMLFGLGGCSTVSGWLTSPNSAPVVQAAVDVAVATAEAKGISAAQINSIAHRALEADQGTGATLAAVSAVVQSEIQKLRLPAPDQAAADILLAALSASIQTQLQGNPTVAQVQTAAAVVITSVIAATGG